MKKYSSAQRIRMTCEALLKYGQEHDLMDDQMAFMIGFIRGKAYELLTSEEKKNPFTEEDMWGINESTEMQPND